jgi:hypothetical protein
MAPTRKTLIAITTLSSILSGGLVLAQTPPASPNPPAAPTDQSFVEQADPTDLSSINGQLVPVGEHNEYHYSFRRTNISINPLGIIAGIYGISGSYALSQHVAIRGEFDYWKPIDSNNETGVEVDIGVPLYFRRTYQGLFLEPGVMYRSMTSPDYQGIQTTDTTAGPQALVGWHWSWDSGLNLAAAVGVGRSLNGGSGSSGSIGSSGSSDDGLFANGYVRFGYEF